MGQEVLPAELSNEIRVRRSTPPTREGVVEGQEIGVVCSNRKEERVSASLMGMQSTKERTDLERELGSICFLLESEGSDERRLGVERRSDGESGIEALEKGGGEEEFSWDE